MNTVMIDQAAHVAVVIARLKTETKSPRKIQYVSFRKATLTDDLLAQELNA